jgi:hypothetical protein
MILSDRLISHSCRALSRMIGVRLPGGGAYRAASEAEADRGLPLRPAARPAPPFSSRSMSSHRSTCAAAVFFCVRSTT